LTLDVKICGLSTAETLEAAIAAGASHVGFVHFPPSPRHLGLAEMAALRARVGGRARVVVVLVDPDDALLDRLAAEVRPDWLQLHGREAPERVAAAKARTGLPVMKALSVSAPEDLAALDRYRGVADRLLLDSKRPKGSVLPGGNGVSFDWRILADLDPGLDVMLSGGLHAGNVGEALRVARPQGLDASSGLESAPGVKDPARIRAFFDALARAPVHPSAPEEALAR
jgi:phosphoribosylanthranilate isomerase